MKRLVTVFAVVAIALGACATGPVPRSATVVDFESVVLPAEGFSNGSDGKTAHEVAGVSFAVEYDDEYDSWSGVAISSMNDTEAAGFTNQYSVYAGAGAAESQQFAVVNGFVGEQINFARPSVVYGLYATNGTYPARSMMEGDQFAKAFSFEDEDFFKAVFTGYGADGATTGEVTFYLADFRSEDPEQNTVMSTCGGPILDCWAFVDLSPLGAVSTITVSFESSDIGDYGINTPAYVMIDNLAFEPTE